MINAAKGQTHNNGERQGVIDIGFGYSNDTDDQSVLHNSMGFDSFLQKQEIGNFGQELDADWMCIASDYSVQYKRMHKRHYPLHSNNMSINVGCL